MPFTKADKNINRNGRPKKGQSLTDILNFELDQKEGGTLKRQRIAQRLVELAEGGDFQAIRYIFDRTDGKCAETVKADIAGKMAIDSQAARLMIYEKLMTPDERQARIDELSAKYIRSKPDDKKQQFLENIGA
jgi:hypothetical protein